MKSNGIRLDRMSPNTALAQIATILNGVNNELSKTGVTLNDFIKLAISDISAIAGTFDSDTFEEDYRMHLTDIIYPVGTYYETSLSEDEFDPNAQWAGTWVLEKDEEDIGGGRVHISADDTYILGDTGGETEHTLIIDELPAHTHEYTHPTAKDINAGKSEDTVSVKGPNDTFNTGSTGGGLAHNNMQPYVVINRWHRIS